MKLKNEEEIPPEVLRSFSFPGDHEESRRQFFPNPHNASTAPNQSGVAPNKNNKTDGKNKKSGQP